MRQLCHNIINATPIPPSSRFSADLRDLVNKVLTKDSKLRPGINNILSRPIIKNRIRDFLNETKFQNEFNHTVLHGMNVLNGPPPMPVAAAPKPIAANMVPPPSSAIPRSNHVLQSNPLLAPQRLQPVAPAPQPGLKRQSPLPTPAHVLTNPSIVASPPLPKGPPPAGMVVPVKKPDIAVNIPSRKPGDVVSIQIAGAFSKGTPVVRVPPSLSVAVNNSNIKNNNNNNNAARLRVQMKPPVPNQQPQQQLLQQLQQAPSPRNEVQRPPSNNQVLRPPVSNSNLVQPIKPAPFVHVQQQQKQQQQQQPVIPIRAVSADSNNRRRKNVPDQDAQSVNSEKSNNSNNAEMDINKYQLNIIVGARNAHSPVVAGVARIPVHAADIEKRKSPLTVVETSNNRLAAPSPLIPQINMAEKIAAARAMKQNIPAVAASSPFSANNNKNAMSNTPLVPSNFASQAQNRLIPSEVRRKEVDAAANHNKVAQRMQNLNAPVDRSPVPFMSPPFAFNADAMVPMSRLGGREPSFAAVGAAVLSKPEPRAPIVGGAPSAVKVPLTEKEKEDNLSWLSNLQSQMGALQQQVQVLQQNHQHSPVLSSPVPAPAPAVLVNKDQARESPAPSGEGGGGGAVVGGKNYAVKRQSFPVDDRRVKMEKTPYQVPSGLDAPHSVGSVASSVASSNSNNSNKNKKKKGGDRVSEAKPEAAKGRNPLISPVPVVDLDQRRELREKHKMGFREFLKQQRGQDGPQTPLTNAGSMEENEDAVCRTSIVSSWRSTSMSSEPTSLAVVEAGSWDMDRVRSPPPSSGVPAMQQSERSISSASTSTATSTSTKVSTPVSSHKESPISLRNFVENQRRAAHIQPDLKEACRNHGHRSSVAEAQIVGSSQRYPSFPPSNALSSAVKSVALTAANSRAGKSEWIQEEMFTYIKHAEAVDIEHPTTSSASRWNNRDDASDAGERPTNNPPVRSPDGLHSIVDDHHRAPMRGCNLSEAFVDDDELELKFAPEEFVSNKPPSAAIQSEEGFLGRSFILQMHDEEQQGYRMVLDAQAAMEYSIMIQQMQDILQLGAVQAKKLDAANYESSRTGMNNEHPTSGEISKKSDEKLSEIEGSIEGTEEEIEEGFEEASFTFYLSDSDEENNGSEENGDDLNEFGEERLKEIADPVAKDVVTEDAWPNEPIVGDMPIADHEQPLFTRTDPTLFAQLGRPRRSSGSVGVESARDDAEEKLVDVDGSHSDATRYRLPMDPFHDTRRNGMVTKLGCVADSAQQPSAAISAESEAQLQASLSKTQKQRIYRKLVMLLGVDRLEKGLQFLSSTYLEDENADEEYLLNILEEIVGTENLYCLEDMYYILSI